METNDKVVYVLLDKSKPGIFLHCGCQFDYEPFWVGQGRPYRPIESACAHKRCHGIISEIVVLFTGLSREEAVELEYQLTDLIGRRVDGNGPLLNIVRGRKCESAVQIKLKSERFIKSNIARRGEVRSEEYRRKIGEATRKVFSDPAKRQKMAESMRRYHAKRRAVA